MTDAVPVRKMSGAGNDFVVVRGDAAAELGPGIVDWVRAVCRRGLSVGADGVLAVTPSGSGRVHVRYWNADGSEAFCGNGTRCAARFARLEGWVGETAVLDTRIGEVSAVIRDSRVQLVLPAPEDRGELVVDVAGTSHGGRFVVAGVPHFVVHVDDVDRAPLSTWGPEIRRHPRFGADGTNLDVIAIDPNGTCRLRTWERGVEGETLACGTGAIAAAVAARDRIGGEGVRVLPRSGSLLEVRWRPDGTVELIGDARVILEGSVGPESLGT